MRKTSIYSEQYFQEILYRERKRSERSGRLLLLMLIHDSQNRELLPFVAEGISKAIRDADICGWYKTGSTLAVLFTELWKDSPAAHIDLVKGKMRTIVSGLIPADGGFTDVSFQVFPQKFDSSEPEKSFDPVFYSEMKSLPLEKMYNALKRGIDIAVSTGALVFFAPAFLILALLIKVTSHGTVFFRQERIGQYGKKFT